MGLALKVETCQAVYKHYEKASAILGSYEPSDMAIPCTCIVFNWCKEPKIYFSIYAYILL